MIGAPATIQRAEFEDRRRRAVELAKSRGLRGLLVCSRGGGSLDRYADVKYLTNFYTPFPCIPDLAKNWSGRGHAFVILPVDAEPLLVADVPNDGSIALDEDRICYGDMVIEGAVDAMRRSGLDSGPIGLVGGDALPVNAFKTIETALENVEWRDAQDVLTGLRAIKSPAEIALLRHAAGAGSRMIEAMMEAAVPGARHGEIVAAGLQVLVPAGGILYNSFMASGRGGGDPVLVKSNFPTWASNHPLVD